jgi:hypothetical protein
MHRKNISSLDSRQQKDRFAAIIRSTNIYTPIPGGNCLWRTLSGQAALLAIGIKTQIAAGGMLYRAGHDPVLDTVGFAGLDFCGTVLPNGRLLGHFWLVTEQEGTLIDFSPGDWQEIVASIAEVDVFSPHERPIEWVVSPSEYYWAPLKDFKRSPGDGQAPKLGHAWYTGWSSQSAIHPTELVRAMANYLFDGPGKLLLRNVCRQVIREGKGI